MRAPGLISRPFRLLFKLMVFLYDTILIANVCSFLCREDSFRRKHVLETNDVDAQRGKMMHLLGVKVVFALSPQDKAKV